LTGDGLFQFETRISSRKSKTQSKAICPDKNKSRLFQFETRISSRKRKKQSKAIRPDKNKSRAATSLVVTFFRLFVQRGRVALLLNGGLNKYIADGCWVLLIPPPARRGAALPSPLFKHSVSQLSTVF
jgi:hypothetical protein